MQYFNSEQSENSRLHETFVAINKDRYGNETGEIADLKISQALGKKRVNLVIKNVRITNVFFWRYPSS